MQPEKDRTLYVKFSCKSCGHTFNRLLHRIYIDEPTLDRHLNQEPTTHSEFIVPIPIVCTKCKTVNQVEITPMSQSWIRMSAVLRGKFFPRSAPDDPVQVVTFKFEGNLMHPLEALVYYHNLIERKPEYLPHHLRHANILRMIGHWDEAVSEYQYIVDKDPTQLEAWYNLAALAFSRKQKRVARNMLENLLLNAPLTKDSRHKTFEQDATDILDGALPFESLSLDFMVLRAPSMEGLKRKRQRNKRKK
jgi:phage FluMu protein Com